MYIEEVIAGIIRAAAASGEIPGLSGSEIYTDLNGTNEWEGRSKIYVIRDRIDLLGDLGQEYNYSGTARSQLTLAALGADKETADPIIRGAIRALLRHLNSPPTPLDLYDLNSDLIPDPDIRSMATAGTDPCTRGSLPDEVFLDQADTFAVDWEEAATDEALIDPRDTVTIGEKDTAVFGFLDAKGPVTGRGWVIASLWTGQVAPWLIYDPLARQIFDWRLDAASGVERFDTGAWREQYFSTKTLDVLHYVKVQ